MGTSIATSLDQARVKGRCVRCLEPGYCCVIYVSVLFLEFSRGKYVNGNGIPRDSLLDIASLYDAADCVMIPRGLCVLARCYSPPR